MDTGSFGTGDAVAGTDRNVRHRVDGKFLLVEGRRFFIKGVTYGTFRPNEEGEPFPPFRQVREDFARMRDAGINTVRLYAPPPDRVADAAADAGLYLIPDLCWVPRRCEELDEPDRLRGVYDWTRENCRRLAGHPALLLHSIGNEIPPLIVRWYGRHRIEAFFRTLHDIVKEEAPDALVTYANHPPCEHLHLPFLDVVSFNLYLEREPDFRAYLARLQSLAGERPLLLSELGLDARSHGPEEQARTLRWQLRAVFERGLCGATVYSWTDEWALGQEDIAGWSFGLTDAQRRPKPALEAVRETYSAALYALRDRPWPPVSVVVASYNGGRTLDACLRSLERLNYPNYEVVVVDDGSTDDTPEIVARHPVRCVRVENGGLSQARNIGIEASRGEIVAFTDSDACPDPDWLYYMVTALEEQDAAAVGGPNLSPPEDGFIAQCVDQAPGNPTHVLLDDQRADHVPGCNMAFRRDALARINGFDHTHRTAGDDVDVCWKLLVREKTIAFSPGAVVWHHRRATVRGFLRQQDGYGYAEAYLQRRYPGHFNVFGHLVWQGAVYDEFHAALRRAGPFPTRIYQGRFGGAPFQALYQPFAIWWFQIFTAAEWQASALCVLAAGLLALWMASPAAAALLLGAAATMIGMTLAGVGVAAISAVRAKRWRGRERLYGCFVVAYLHLTQPLARAAGRFRGWRHTRHDPWRYPAVRRFWGNLPQRDAWLERLHRHLSACSWVSRPSSVWGDSDIDVLGPGPYALKLSSTHEESPTHGEHRIRYRVTAKMKPYLPPLLGAMALTLLAFLARPYLLPLAAPLLALLCRLLGARRAMITAVSQLATECAEALNLPIADPGRDES